MAATDSQLKDSLRRLDEYRRLNAAIFEASSDGLAILDGQGRFVQVNGAWQRIMGRRQEEVVGRTEREIEALPRPAGATVWERICSATVPGTMLIKSDGDTLVVTARLDLAEGGRVRHAILCVRSLSRLSDLKEQLRQYEIGDYAKIDEFHAAQLKSLLRALGFNEVVLAGRAFRNVLTLVTEVAALDATVLISGETGTGKGLVAKLVHRLSRRAAGAFVEVNCGAIPENLVESELFGYRPGAFTDALRSGKQGQIEAAHGGSLFLDEVSELPLSAQVKLLKFLDDKLISPLGSGAPRRVDVRIIAASNADLKALCDGGKFRQDLFYRLDVIPVTIPPLRERREEIAPMVENFLGCFNLEFGENRTLAPEVLPILTAYDYPGNIRELRNLIARLVISAAAPRITAQDLPDHIRAAAPSPPAIDTVVLGSGQDERFEEAIALRRHFQESEREILERYARSCHSVREIGRHLGLHHSSVARKLRKYQISPAPRDTSRR